MSDMIPSPYQLAIQDFKRMRQRAAMQQMMARLRGESADLLAYHEVHEKLQATETVERGLREIPLDAIVGSVGRYQDFTRDFLPKKDSAQARWTLVKTAVMTKQQMSPIEVYQVGEVYFVEDGNHRVSVARQLGMDSIMAHVTEVKTRVPLTDADDPDEFICKARYVSFLEETNLDTLRPGADLFMTFCDQFELLLDQIEAYRMILAEKAEREIGDEEAAQAWYDEVYSPVVQVIRERGFQRNFPERTEADLYVLLSRHQDELTEELGWDVDFETAVADLIEAPQPASRQFASKVGRLLGAIIPEGLAPEPKPGQWRRGRLSVRPKKRLFADILVAMRNPRVARNAFEQALLVAERENGRLHGLQVLASDQQVDVSLVQEVETWFDDACQTRDIQGEFGVEQGGMARTIIRKASWVDLVVVSVDQEETAETPLERLGSKMNTLVQGCPRPILAVPEAPTPLDKGLLAYDGSAKADEALFVATYLALRWQMGLTVVTVETEHTRSEALEQAREYLTERGVSARYVMHRGDIAQAILETAEAEDSNLLIMGGFGYRPMMHLVLGSTVDRMLREFKRPMLICR